MPKAPKINPNKAAAAVLAAAATPPLVNNCVWSNNNAACVNTWFCLSKQVLGQIDASFDDAALLEMTELAYWNELAGDDNRKVEAAALADILTKLFTNIAATRCGRTRSWPRPMPASTLLMR